MQLPAPLPLFPISAPAPLPLRKFLATPLTAPLPLHLFFDRSAPISAPLQFAVSIYLTFYAIICKC